MGGESILICALLGPPRLDAGVHVIVREALVPCLIWPDVEVSRAIRHKLTVIERFILEAGVQFGHFDEYDIEEITSIPAHVVRRFLLRLVRSGTAVVEGRTFKINHEMASQALAQAFTTELKAAKLTFLYFPVSDDLLACPDDGDDVRRIVGIRPVFSRPMHQELANAPVASLLARRIETRLVARLPRDIVRLSTENDLGTIPKLCPVWRASAKVHITQDEPELCVTFFGDSRKNPSREAHADLRLSGATKLASEWTTLSESLSEKRHWPKVCRELGLNDGGAAQVRVLGPSRYAVCLNPQQAEELFETKTCLANAHGFAIESEEFIVEVEVTCEPEQPDEAHLFVIDRAVVAVRNTPLATLADVQAAVIKHCAAQGLSAASSSHVTSDAVLSRLWELGDFGIIYSLRARADFSYEDIR